MKIWIVYGSSYGQAEAVARRIGERLRHHGHAVRVSNGESLPPGVAVTAFDAVLVVASVIMGRHRGYIRDFVRRNLKALTARPTGFVSVSGTLPDTSAKWRKGAREYVDRFLATASWKPTWTVSFPGALRFTRYGFVVRWVMKRISRSTGGPTDTSRDYEFTNWTAVDQFADGVGADLARRDHTRLGGMVGAGRG